MIEILPYERVGSVAFGMTVAQVASVLGQPDKVFTNRRKERDERRVEMSIRYSATDARVVEVALLPSTKAMLRGVDIFNDPTSFNQLVRLDGEPFESLGFVILLKLGITLTGFHDQDEAQKAVTAFAPGRWDSVRADFTPFDK